MKHLLSWMLIGSLFLCACNKNILSKTYNQYDKKKQKHGRWRTYYEPNQISKKEHFKHGRPRGKWIHYLPNGNAYLIEKYKKKGTLVKQRSYHPNGILERKGTALETADSAQVWYRWHGTQYFYDTLGTLLYTKYYYQGDFVRKESPNPSKHE